MKKVSAFNILLMTISMLFMTACEKHDGLYYSKSKCTVELNGKTYIDQTPFTITPDAIRTPELTFSEKDLTFFSMLRAERGGDIVFSVKIQIYTDEPESFLDKEQMIEKMAVDLGTDPTWTDYVDYCRENKISYARVDSEIVDRGTFKITSYDKEQHHFKGTFTLHFSEGTLVGEFEM